MYAINSHKEFARRLLISIKDYNSKYVVFIGAGCSKQSGIPTAKELTLEYLGQIKYFEVGDDMSFDDWLKINYPNFEMNKAAVLSREALRRRFIFDKEIPIEIEKIINGKEPSEGYIKLAKIAHHRALGKNFNLFLTTNFDNLLEKSFGKARIFMGESTKPADSEHALIIQLQSDTNYANGASGNHDINEITVKILQKFQELNIIFLGYGGNDQKIVDILKGINTEKLCRIFWVNEDLPFNSDMIDWLEQNKAAWVKHSNFEELMDYLYDQFKCITIKNKRISIEELERALLKNGIVLKSKGQFESFKDSVRYLRNERNGEDLSTAEIRLILNNILGDNISSERILESLQNDIISDYSDYRH